MAILRTLSAERTPHAIGKNYASKTIPAGKLLERDSLDRYKEVFNLKTFYYLLTAWLGLPR